MKVLIVGGVAGGATAAARLRRLDEQAEIIVFERSGYISYANCGLPYYIGGEITDKRELTLQTPESFYNRFRIDVRVHQEVLHIDAEAKCVKVRNLTDGTEYVENYDKLILSPGAKPVKPNLPGMKDERIFTLRTVEDTFEIHDFVEEKQPKSAVIIGGGFIGLEMAENLLGKGLDVTVVQRPNQVMSPIDKNMAAIVHNYLRSKGVKLMLGASVNGFEKNQMNGKLDTLIQDRESISADMVILAVGVMPESTLAKGAGLELGIKDSIVVNEHMQTSQPEIYAVGDAVEVRHFVSGERALIALAGPANKQGRIAADHICGIESSYKGSQGSSVLKLFDMTVASTGLNEKTAWAAGIAFDAVILSPASHATYYPGAASMTMKVLFEKGSGKILGGQIVGFGGVDKRIDVLATAIRAEMSAYDLTELDLAYAPPYSSAKDPVNMAGFMIENILTEKVKQVQWEDLENLPENTLLLDTRTEREYNRGHIEGAINLPVDTLRSVLQPQYEMETMSETVLPKDKTYYVHCQSGLRSYLACRILSQYGYDCYNVAGGYEFYQQTGMDVPPEAEGKGPCGLKR